jgi:hypothetical protein
MPWLERLAAEYPKDAVVIEHWRFATLSYAETIADPELKLGRRAKQYGQDGRGPNEIHERLNSRTLEPQFNGGGLGQWADRIQVKLTFCIFRTRAR